MNTEEYNFKDEKYVLLTVSDEYSVIQMYDWIITDENYLQETESIVNNSAISITVYNEDESIEFFEAVNLLRKSKTTKWIDILDSILIKGEMNASNQE